MDVFTILSYLNKVSLIAFIITTVVVAYQIYIFKKEKTKEINFFSLEKKWQREWEKARIFQVKEGKGKKYG